MYPHPKRFALTRKGEVNAKQQAPARVFAACTNAGIRKAIILFFEPDDPEFAGLNSIFSPSEKSLNFHVRAHACLARSGAKGAVEIIFRKAGNPEAIAGAAAQQTRAAGIEKARPL